jgi:hypothetical protein
MRALMRGDNKSRAEYYRTMVEIGAYTRNDVRELEDMNPLDGLDEPLTPMNMNQGDEAQDDTDDKDDTGDEETKQLRYNAEGVALKAVKRLRHLYEAESYTGFMRAAADFLQDDLRLYIERRLGIDGKRLVEELYAEFCDAPEPDALLDRWERELPEIILAGVPHA